VKLFIGHLALSDDEFLLTPLFERFGELEEVVVLRDPRTGTSKRSGFVRFSSRASADAAIAVLNGASLLPGREPVVVKYARARMQKEEQPGEGGRGAAPAVQYDELPAHGYGASPRDPPTLGSVGHGPPSGEKDSPAGGYGMYKSNGRPVEGPAGANLFIYHLPQGLTDEDLANAFSNFGPVVSAKVYVDKRTGESRGFGFVSYSDAMHASSAIQGMNGFSLGNKKLKVEHKKPTPKNKSATSVRALNVHAGAFGGGPMAAPMYPPPHMAHLGYAASPYSLYGAYTAPHLHSMPPVYSMPSPMAHMAGGVAPYAASHYYGSAAGQVPPQLYSSAAGQVPPQLYSSAAGQQYAPPHDPNMMPAGQSPAGSHPPLHHEVTPHAGGGGSKAAQEPPSASSGEAPTEGSASHTAALG
jgi:CUG-BP- and ETR3-like factor